MRRTIRAVAGAALLAPSVLSAQARPTRSAATPVVLQDGWKVGTLDEARIDLQRIAAMADAIRADSAINVHAVLIEHDGRLVFEEYFSGRDERWGRSLGTVTYTRDMPHDLRSVSKSVVASLVGIALDQGAIRSLDAPLVGFFPEFTDLQTPERQRVTLRHALTMSTGFEWDESISYTDPRNSEIAMTRAERPLHYALSRPFTDEPGNSYAYNGGTTQVIAAIVHRATGTPIDQYLRRMLMEPLGITQYEWVGELAGMPAAASGIRMRARDLAKFGSLYLNAGRWNGKQVLPADWVRESLLPRISMHRRAEWQYGYQWWHQCIDTPTGGVRLPVAVGNGGQRIFVLPEQRLVITTFAGEYNRPTSPDRLLQEYILPAITPVRAPACGATGGGSAPA